MKLKRFLSVLLVYAAIAACLPIPVSASESPCDHIISLEDLEWEWIDLTAVECPEDGIMPMADASAGGLYSPHSISYVTSFIDFNVNDVITFNCSYSPSPASVDFGVITSSGKFYSINVKEGSINQAIRINQAGSYAVAIRNNSSQTVSVVGFVEY